MVAPLAGAWIEITKQKKVLTWWCPSLPSRGRGLKSADKIVYVMMHESLPSRGRGLKYDIAYIMDAMAGRSPRGGVD